MTRAEYMRKYRARQKQVQRLSEVAEELRRLWAIEDAVQFLIDLDRTAPHTLGEIVDALRRVHEALKPKGKMRRQNTVPTPLEMTPDEEKSLFSEDA